MITIDEIITSDSVIGKFAEHLAAHPKQFIELAQRKIRLAKDYAEGFTDAQVKKLFAGTQNERVNVIYAILSIRPDRIEHTSDKHQLELYLKEMWAEIKTIETNAWTYVPYYEDYDNNYSHTYLYDSKVLITIEIGEDNKVPIQGADIVHNKRAIVDETAINDAYDAFKGHPDFYQLQHALVSSLVNRPKVEIGIYDSEFITHAPSPYHTMYSRVFTRRQNESMNQENALDVLIARNKFELIGEILVTLSPEMLMAELQKVRPGIKDLMTFMVANYADFEKALITVFVLIKTMQQPVIEQFMNGFNADVLGDLQKKSPDIARFFYDIHPESMKRTFPKSSKVYS